MNCQLTEYLNAIEKANPLFLIGPPRSGTTFLCKMLNAHLNILLTNETAVFLQLGENIRKSRKGFTAGILYGKEYHKLWAEHVLENYRMLVETYYAKIAAKEKKKQLVYWGEKHPHLNWELPLLQDIYPDAVYVYVIRDPRDSSCSIAEMNKIPVTKALENWKRFSDCYESFVEKIPRERIAICRYEDVVSDYAGVARSLFDDIAIDFTDEVKDFIEKNKDRDAHLPSGLIKKIIRQNYKKKSVGRWKKEMTRKEKKYSERLVGDFLHKYHYI